MPFLGVEPVQEFASVAKQTITGTGATSYSLNHSVASANDLAVFVNNVRQEPTSAYTASGGTITFTSALASTDSCYVMYIARTFSSATAEANSIGITELNVSDGSNGQALTTNGSGTLSFSTISTPTLDAVTGTGATTTNAITIGNLTSTGIDDNATSTAITIDSSENVGIGGSPSSSSSYRTLNIIGGADVGGALRLSTTANENGHVFQYNDGIYLSGDEVTFISTGDPGVSGDVKTAYRVDRTAQLHRWYDPLDGSTERMRILSSGGITFNGDTAAANALDDYEEGTWTPTSVSNVSAIANANGHYTKIGNVVTINFFADITPSANSSYIALGGLPYSVDDAISGSNVEGTGVVFEDSNLYMFFALGSSSNLWIEYDRPIQGSSDTLNRSYRGSLSYFTS